MKDRPLGRRGRGYKGTWKKERERERECVCVYVYVPF
jgi:hypothetical protein